MACEPIACASGIQTLKINITDGKMAEGKLRHNRRQKVAFDPETKAATIGAKAKAGIQICGVTSSKDEVAPGQRIFNCHDHPACPRYPLQFLIVHVCSVITLLAFTVPRFA